MSRELATSREIATREIANRSNQGLYIKENDWMIWQKAADGQSHLHDIYTYFSYPDPFSIQFLYCPYSKVSGSLVVANCTEWPASDGKYKGLFILPTYLSLFSDYIVNKEILRVDYNNVMFNQAISLLTFIFDGINSDVLQNKSSIKKSCTDTCENFVMESQNFYWSWSGTMYPISQSVSHFQIWNKAISSDEISYCYDRLFSGESLLGTEDGLVCYFPMQEGINNTITDIVGGKTGTLAGAEWRNYGGLREAA